MALAKPVEAYASIATCASGLREQWGEDLLALEPERCAAVVRFCEAIDTDPDALVAGCFLRRRETGERFGSVPRRTALLRRLDAYLAASGRSPGEQRRERSSVLSFLIHNGVQM